MMVEEKAYIYYVLLLMSYFCFSVKVQLLRMIGVFFVNLNLHQIKSNGQYNGCSKSDDPETVQFPLNGTEQKK